MDDCEIRRSELAGLLADARTDAGTDPGSARLRAHVDACPACRRELEELREVWTRLPPSAAMPPPPGLRRAVLAESRAVGEPAGVPARRMWRPLRRVALSVGLGAAGAGAVVLSLGLRGSLSVTDPVATAWLALALAAGLAVVAHGLIERVLPPGVGGVLAASLATFTGYVVLSLVQPVPETVEFCRVSVLGADALSRGSLCLVYLGVAALYGGAPAGLAAWRWADRPSPWPTGLAVAAIFALLAAPFLGLHLGLEDLVLTASALLGLTVGALGGNLAGGLARRLRWPSAVG